MRAWPGVAVLVAGAVAESQPILYVDADAPGAGDELAAGRADGPARPDRRLHVRRELVDAVRGGHELNTVHYLVDGCTFTGNQADADSGALWIGVTVKEDAEPAVVRGCRFADNEAAFGLGGAILCTAADVVVAGCEFYGNRSPLGFGGAIRTGPVLGFGGGGQDLFAQDRRFSGNTAKTGGAISTSNTPLIEVDSSSFPGNAGEELAGAGRARRRGVPGDLPGRPPLRSWRAATHLRLTRWSSTTTRSMTMCWSSGRTAGSTPRTPTSSSRRSRRWWRRGSGRSSSTARGSRTSPARGSGR